MRHQSVVLGFLLFTGGAAPAALPTAHPNDNRAPAGSVSDSGLTIDLEARRVMWYPDGDSLPGRFTEAFGERGKAPVIPGPLVRVRAGTTVRFRVSNTDIADTLRFLVPAAIAGSVDTVMIPPGARRERRVMLTQPGNYFYRAVTTDVQSQAFFIKGLLAGAIVVDSAVGTPRADRVFVVNWLVDSLTAKGDAPNYDRMMFAVNGRSWPHTERISATVGDSIRWRIVNLNNDTHPMHLHGVYFRVDDFSGPPAAMAATGAPGRMAVTERMAPFTTMTMTWAPERAGNWLFHCHFAFHLVPPAILEKGEPATITAPADDHGVHANHALTGMAGIVMGIHVAPRPGFSPTIELRRGEPVSIMVVNTTREATAVHWHGMELESYYDGAAGFGGQGNRISPTIAARDSFEARFTPPRSGTFIYHSHVNETRQHAAGLLGALIVREPSASTANDHAIMLKADRLNPLSVNGPVEINGQINPDTITIPVGRPTRFRLMNLSMFHPNARYILTARRDSTATLTADSLEVRWRQVAKDGADLPEARRVDRPARQIVSMGETYDYLYTPSASGDLRLEVRAGNGTLLARVPIRVR